MLARGSGDTGSTSLSLGLGGAVIELIIGANVVWARSLIIWIIIIAGVGSVGSCGGGSVEDGAIVIASVIVDGWIVVVVEGFVVVGFAVVLVDVASFKDRLNFEGPEDISLDESFLEPFVEEDVITSEDTLASGIGIWGGGAELVLSSSDDESIL